MKVVFWWATLSATLEGCRVSFVWQLAARRKTTCIPVPIARQLPQRQGALLLQRQVCLERIFKGSVRG